jgi:hypothetical protein
MHKDGWFTAISIVKRAIKRPKPGLFYSLLSNQQKKKRFFLQAFVDDDRFIFYINITLVLFSFFLLSFAFLSKYSYAKPT